MPLILPLIEYSRVLFVICIKMTILLIAKKLALTAQNKDLCSSWEVSWPAYLERIIEVAPMPKYSAAMVLEQSGWIL